jgi:hypothetical protein
MPSALDPGDRKLLLVGVAILLVLSVATVLLAPSQDDAPGRGIPTTYSTRSGGTQAAYLLLQELGYQSERWEQSPTELPSDNDALGKILILASPINFPQQSERKALLRFARSGGWILYSGNFPFLFVESGAVTPPSFKEAVSGNVSFPPVAPSLFTRDAPEITLFEPRWWLASDGNQVPLYGKPDEPVVVTWRLDKGRILWLATPTPITNSGITLPGNLSFFLDCIEALRARSNPGETTVLWDEYFHGYRGSLWTYFRETPVPWAIVQLALVAWFVFLSFGRRSGPLYAPVIASRLSPLEFVDTLGDLYRRASAGPAAVRVAYQRFRGLLTRRLALAPTTSNTLLDAAARERLGWKQPGLFDTLQRAEKASRSGEVAGADALSIVQALEHYEVLFGLKTRSNPGAGSTGSPPE